MSVASGHADASSGCLHLGSQNAALNLGIVEVHINVVGSARVADIGNAGFHQSFQIFESADGYGCIADGLADTGTGIGAHMYMAVEKSGKKRFAAQVNDLCPFRNRNAGADFFYDAGFHENVSVFKDCLSDDINDVCVGKYCGHDNPPVEITGKFPFYTWGCLCHQAFPFAVTVKQLPHRFVY